MNAPKLELAGWTLNAPVTVATNLILAVQCALLARALLRGQRSLVTRYWGLFFLFMAVATLAGAAKHGYPADARDGMWRVVFLLSNTAAGISMACAGLATVETWVGNAALQRWLRRALGIQVVAVGVGSLLWTSFAPTLAGTVVVLGPVLAVEAVAAVHGRRGSRAIAAGLMICALTGGLYVLETSVGPWLNHIDLGHLLMFVSLGLVYYGVVRRTEPGTAPLRSRWFRTHRGR